MAENIPLSIVLALVTALANGVGFYLQKKGQTEIHTEGLSFIKYILTAARNWKWLVGFTLTVVHIPLYVYALNIGLITITQPLANTGIVFIVLLGMKFLGEKLSKVELAGLCMLIAGIFIIAFTPTGDFAPPTDGQLVEGLGILAIIMGIAYAACIALIFMKRKAISLAFIAGLSMGVAAILIRALSIMIEPADFLDLGNDIKVALGIFRGELMLESLLLYGALLFLLIYFVTVVLALRAGKLTFVIPVEMGTSFILPVFAGFFLFLEPAMPTLIIGIIACLVGALILSNVQAAMDEKLARKPTPAAQSNP
jgi:drug/metabolite transporter (DMT)-like permease